MGDRGGSWERAAMDEKEFQAFLGMAYATGQMQE